MVYINILEERDRSQKLVLKIWMCQIELTFLARKFSFPGHFCSSIYESKHYFLPYSGLVVRNYVNQVCNNHFLHFYMVCLCKCILFHSVCYTIIRSLTAILVINEVHHIIRGTAVWSCNIQGPLCLCVWHFLLDWFGCTVCSMCCSKVWLHCLVPIVITKFAADSFISEVGWLTEGQHWGFLEYFFWSFILCYDGLHFSKSLCARNKYGYLHLSHSLNIYNNKYFDSIFGLAIVRGLKKNDEVHGRNN